MKSVLIGLSVILALVAGVVVFLIININSVVRNGIELAGPEVLGVPVTVQSVDVSLFSGKGTITDLRVANPEGYSAGDAISIGSLSIEVDPGSLGSDRIHIREISIVNPVITYEGSLLDSNIKQLQQAAEQSAGGTETSEPSTGAAGTGPAFQIDRLALVDAQIGVSLSFLDEPLSLVLPELELTGIGADERASVADVINQVLVALNKSLLPLIQENAAGLTDQLKEASEKLGDKINKAGEKIGNKLKGLFDR